MIGWQANYYDGAYVRRLAVDGHLGPPLRIASGGLDDILLRGDGDGFITTSGRDAGGVYRIIRVAEVVDGHARVSRRVAVSDWTPPPCAAGCCPTGAGSRPGRPGRSLPRSGSSPGADHGRPSPCSGAT